jgi:hypothetical protein
MIIEKYVQGNETCELMNCRPHGRTLKHVVCLYGKTTAVLLPWDSSETIKCKSSDFYQPFLYYHCILILLLLQDTLKMAAEVTETCLLKNNKKWVKIFINARLLVYHTLTVFNRLVYHTLTVFNRLVYHTLTIFTRLVYHTLTVFTRLVYHTLTLFTRLVDHTLTVFTRLVYHTLTVFTRLVYHTLTVFTRFFEWHKTAKL